MLRELEGRRKNQWGGKDWAGEEDLEPGRNRTETWLAGDGGSQLGLQTRIKGYFQEVFRNLL